MKWLLNMFSEFSDAVMGDDGAENFGRRNKRPDVRRHPRGGRPSSQRRRPPPRSHREISDWEW